MDNRVNKNKNGTQKQRNTITILRNYSSRKILLRQTEYIVYRFKCVQFIFCNKSRFFMIWNK